MGYERKRGKLADLNALLRGGGEGRFSLIVGDTAALSNVKYVITLDTDTQLPRDAARQFVGADGASAEPPALRQRRRRKAASVTEGYGILQPRVGVSLPGANRSRYARLHRRRARHRSVHARRLRRLPGPVRRRLVHRQGHLRRRRVRAGARRALSREPDPQPRPARRLLRAVGAAERRAAVRGVSVDATPRTSAGGTAGSAATGSCSRWLLPMRARPRQAAAAESAVGALALEALRQPAAQPRPAGADAAAAARLDRAAARLAVDAGGDRGPAAAVGLRLRRRPAAQARRGAAPAAPRRHRGRRRPACGAGGADARLPALRGDGQPRCDRAHAVADARHAPAACSNGGRRRDAAIATVAPSGTAALPRRSGAMWIAPALAPIARRRLALSCGPTALAVAAPILAAVVRLAGHRLVDQPAAARAAKRG